MPPPQPPVRPLGVETIKPAGNGSVKPIPLSDVPVLGLDNVKVKAVVPFNGMLAAPKVFAIAGGKVCGGSGALYDPPPHPAADVTPKPRIVQPKTNCTFCGTP